MAIQDRIQSAINHMKSKGWSENAIKALCLNIAIESAWDASVTNSIGAMGLVQWYNKGAFQTEIAQHLSNSETDVNWQIDHFTDSRGGYMQTASYPISMEDFFKSNKDVNWLVEAWLYNFERPGVETGRYERGNAWFVASGKALNDYDFSGSGKSATGGDSVDDASEDCDATSEETSADEGVVLQPAGKVYFANFTKASAISLGQDVYGGCSHGASGAVDITLSGDTNIYAPFDGTFVDVDLNGGSKAHMAGLSSNKPLQVGSGQTGYVFITVDHDYNPPKTSGSFSAGDKVYTQGCYAVAPALCSGPHIHTNGYITKKKVVKATWAQVSSGWSYNFLAEDGSVQCHGISNWVGSCGGSDPTMSSNIATTHGKGGNYSNSNWWDIFIFTGSDQSKFSGFASPNGTQEGGATSLPTADSNENTASICRTIPGRDTILTNRNSLNRYIRNPITGLIERNY